VAGIGVGAYYQGGKGLYLELGEQENTCPVVVNLEAERIRHTAEMACRSKIKVRMMQRVVSGQWLLPQAADYLRLLDEADPSFHWIEKLYPGESVEERYCRAVMDMVEDPELRLDRAHVAGIKNRLEAELDQLLMEKEATGARGQRPGSRSQ
jgi:hypothetical protein